LRLGQCCSCRFNGLIEFLLVLSNEALFQSPEFFGVLLCDFVRSRRWGTAQFVGSFIHRSLDGNILLVRRLLARNLLITYPSTELFLLKPRVSEI
jgi:hypothetical protein